MNRFLLIGFLLLSLHGITCAQDEDSPFTIYLVRHAEKEVEAVKPDNPALSSCGQLRAESLATVLSDVELDKIYSTEYERTLATARPSAETQQLEIEIYDPRKLEDFSVLLLERQQSALVVGHSNTTGVLAGLLVGESGEEMDEAIYDRLYQVVILGGRGHVNLLHQAFGCDP